MKATAILQTLLIVLMTSAAIAAPDVPVLAHRLSVTPDIKKAFCGHDAIEIKAITGTATNFQVGGTYRITGTCRQETLQHAMLYVGNTAAPGDAAIVAVTGSALSKSLPTGSTEFDCTFVLLRPGTLHVTVYDADSPNKRDNASGGISLGDVTSTDLSTF